MQLLNPVMAGPADGKHARMVEQLVISIHEFSKMPVVVAHFGFGVPGRSHNPPLPPHCHECHEWQQRTPPPPLFLPLSPTNGGKP